MANHKSALKRVRQSERRKLYNRYHSKTMRHALRDFRAITDKKEAESELPKMISVIDKLAQRAIIHKNKAANLKSKCMKQVAAL